MTEYEINGKDYEVEYDLDNRIIKVDVDNNDVEYRYDAFGRRVIRQEGSTKSALIWWGNSEKYRRLVGILDKSVTTCPEGVSSREADANQCAEHKHQAGQTVIQNDIMEHPSRLNSVIARAVDGSKLKLQWYHKNYLDHVYAVSDDSGDILEHYRYTAYGEVSIYDENGNLENTTQIDNHILWNTRRRDEVTGFYMYKFRHYAPELGRWPSRDPIEEDGGVNLYGFVGNDGINQWDKLGKSAWAIIIPFSAEIKTRGKEIHENTSSYKIHKNVEAGIKEYIRTSKVDLEYIQGMTNKEWKKQVRRVKVSFKDESLQTFEKLSREEFIEWLNHEIKTSKAVLQLKGKEKRLATIITDLGTIDADTYQFHQNIIGQHSGNGYPGGGGANAGQLHPDWDYTTCGATRRTWKVKGGPFAFDREKCEITFFPLWIQDVEANP